MSFKLGDKIKLLTDYYEDEDISQNVSKGSILEVLEKCRTAGQWIDQTSVELEFLKPPFDHAKEFEVVGGEVKSKFQIGDRVILTNPIKGLVEGWIGNVVHVLDNAQVWVTDKSALKPTYTLNVEDLELLESSNKPQSALDKQVSGNHYKDCKIQPIEYIQANGLSYLEGNVIKYTTRHSKKNGRKDIEKAIHYLELILEMEYKDKE